MQDYPIGVFDSGLGGLTVVRSLIDLLPREKIIYLGDTAHTPYGNKPIATVRRYALDCLETLVRMRVKLLVIACNSATAAVLADANEHFVRELEIPVVEVVTPAALSSSLATKTGRIGVIGTQATVTSNSYKNALSAVPGVTVLQQACPLLVDYVERGITSGSEVEALLEQYLEPLLSAGIDTLILGCTHYPFLLDSIKQVVGDTVTVVTSSKPTAESVKQVLAEQHKLNRTWPTPGENQYRFLSTHPTAEFEQLARHFLGREFTYLEEANST